MSKIGIYNGASHEEVSLRHELLQEQNEFSGVEVYYIKRENVNLDKLFGADDLEKFTESFFMEVKLLNPSGFSEGQENFGFFGHNINFGTDISIGIEHFKALTDMDEPREKDLIYIPMMKKFFEIRYNNDRENFYNNGNLYSFTITIEQMKYSDNTIETGEKEVDENVPTDNNNYNDDYIDNDILDDEELRRNILNDLDDIKIDEE
jgi:hypothetical protein